MKQVIRWLLASTILLAPALTAARMDDYNLDGSDGTHDDSFGFAPGTWSAVRLTFTNVTLIGTLGTGLTFDFFHDDPLDSIPFDPQNPGTAFARAIGCGTASAPANTVIFECALVGAPRNDLLGTPNYARPQGTTAMLEWTRTSPMVLDVVPLAAAAVPEPASSALACLGTAAFVLARRR